MFDTKRYNVNIVDNDLTRAIDEFFMALKWDQDTQDPIVDEIPFDKLMSQVNMKDRWIYRGSKTSPPCDTFVYWNIPRDVLPLKPEYLRRFKEQLKKTPKLLE